MVRAYEGATAQSNRANSGVLESWRVGNRTGIGFPCGVG